ncbi:hypothetical protein TNCT_727331 [Trichonephila clavata]|uniref:Uncharacterized protein n=1 Tax=Trichonephila clavata TaxID=2740835 RepID=A0A8X6EXA5_TRICU|nr:hypothetical protein TNCT_727331 [Trichonephila clavata]
MEGNMAPPDRPSLPPRWCTPVSHSKLPPPKLSQTVLVLIAETPPYPFPMPLCFFEHAMHIKKYRFLPDAKPTRVNSVYCICTRTLLPEGKGWTFHPPSVTRGRGDNGFGT